MHYRVAIEFLQPIGYLLLQLCRVSELQTGLGVGIVLIDLSGVSNSRSPIESTRQENDANVSALNSPAFEKKMLN
jgi:hypothetical protein